MKHVRIILWLLPLALLGWPGLARAVELKSHAVTSDAKKILMTFTFSSSIKDADFQIVSNYQGNFIALQVKGLSFSKKQLKADLPPADQSLRPFYRFIRFSAAEGAGEVRLYLSKPVDPGDVLIELREGQAELELVKPWWKLDAANPPAASSAAAPEFIPDAAAPAELPPATPLPPVDTGAPPPPDDGFRDVGAPEERAPADVPPPDGAAAQPDWSQPGAQPATPEAPPEEATAASEPDTAQPLPPAGEEPPSTIPAGSRPSAGETYNQTGVGELFGPGTGSQRPPRDKPARPAATDPTPAAGQRPGYTEFDLDQIPISGIEIRGLPFDEALLKLVGSAGFNIIVGKDVEDTEVNLNFTQKQISLKNALDLLCIAYDLSYTIEPDAIVIKGKASAAP